jgi:outer membrane protein assembly factor BamB
MVATNLGADVPESENDYLPLSCGSRSIQNDKWPMFLGEPARTGNTTSTGPSYYHQLWSVGAGIYYGSPVIMYDQIYISTRTATNCYNMSGGLVWTHNAASSYSTPLVFNGRVYVSGMNGILYCLDANATGSSTTTNYWSYSPSGVRNAASSPVTDGKKIYYAVQHISGLHAVWLNNGAKAWNASLGGSTWTESSPAYWDGKVYCGGGYSYDTGTNNLHCFNATNGAELWRFKTGDDVVSTPVIAYGRVFFGSMDSKVYCVDAYGGNGTTTKYWDYNTTAGAYGIYGSAAVAYGRVYIGTTNGNLFCFSAYGTGGTTTLYWNKAITPTGNVGICGSPAVTKDHIFILNTQNAVHCRNRTTGDEVWSERISPYGIYGMSSSPAVYKDTLFIASDNGNLYALGIDKVSPKITSSDPMDEEDNVDLDQNISMVFSEQLNTSTLITSNFDLVDSNNTSVDFTVSWNMNLKIVYLNPSQTFKKDETYKFTVKTGVADPRGNILDGNGNGLSEGPGLDEYIVTFKTIPHNPPKIGYLVIPELIEEVPYQTNISSSITDEDTPRGSLILTEDSEYATLEGYVLRLYYPEGVTSDLINITVSDGLFTAWKEIPVSIKPVNDLPVISEMSVIVVNEDETYTVEMIEYVSDVDTAITELNLFVFSQNFSSKSGYVKKDGLSINLTYPNGVESDIVNVTVYEGELNDGQSASTEFLVKVTPINDKPELDDPLEELEMNEDEVDTSVSLGNWFKDIDDSELSYKASGNDNIDVQINAAGGVTLTPNNNWFGMENITFTATDSGLEEISSVLSVIVKPVNDPPVIESITSPTDGAQFDYDQSIDFNADVTDVDLAFGDELTFYWESDKSGAIGYDKEVKGVVLESGKHIVRLTVTDSNSASVWEQVTVTVADKPVADTDKDGTPDDLDNDDDNDNIPDDWEVKYSKILDPLNPLDAGNDSDGDGYTNLQEYLGVDGKPGGDDASNPQDEESIPKEKKSGGESETETDNSMMFLLMIVVVIVIVVLLIFMFMRKRKVEVEDETSKVTQVSEQQSPQLTQQPLGESEPMQMLQQPLQQPMTMDMTQMPPGMGAGSSVGVGVGVGVQPQPYQDPMMQQQQYQMFDQSQILMPQQSLPSPGQEPGYIQPQMDMSPQQTYSDQQIQETADEYSTDAPLDQDEIEPDTSIEGGTEMNVEPDDSDLLKSASIFSLPPADNETVPETEPQPENIEQIQPDLEPENDPKEESGETGTDETDVND